MRTVLPNLLLLLMFACPSTSYGQQPPPAQPQARPQAQPQVQLYVPGQKLLLTVRNEMRDESVAAEVSSDYVVGVGETNKEVHEHKQSTVTWLELELPLQIEGSTRPDCVAVSLKMRRIAGGESYQGDKGDAKKESFDTATGKAAAGDQLSDKEMRDSMEKLIKTVSFRAVAERSGKVVTFDASGGQFDEMKKDLAAEHDMTQEEKDVRLRSETYGVYSALSNVAAYLPPREVRVGQKWDVVRDKVFPVIDASYGFGMMTGCDFLEERSTCEAKAIKQTPAGRIVAVAITGRRVPKHLGGGVSARVDCLDTSGELRFNLDAQEVVSLRIDTKVKWLGAEDKKYMNISYTDTMTLRKQ